MVIAGALVQVSVFTLVLVDAGHPAATAMALAWAWVTCPAAGCVVVVDVDVDVEVELVVDDELVEVVEVVVVVAGDLPPEKSNAPVPITTTAMIVTMTERRRFFRRLS
jgi:hypothetical protein